MDVFVVDYRTDLGNKEQEAHVVGTYFRYEKACDVAEQYASKSGKTCYLTRCVLNQLQEGRQPEREFRP